MRLSVCHQKSLLGVIRYAATDDKYTRQPHSYSPDPSPLQALWFLCPLLPAHLLLCSFPKDRISSLSALWMRSAHIFQIDSTIQKYLLSASYVPRLVLSSRHKPCLKPSSQIHERVCLAQLDSFYNGRGGRAMSSQAWLPWSHLWMVQ